MRPEVWESLGEEELEWNPNQREPCEKGQQRGARSREQCVSVASAQM